MSVKKQLLDPLGTICKLVALNFSEIKTKISIHNHVLMLHKPYNYQFFIRMLNSDGRENVSELYYAINRVIKWYMIDHDENTNDENNSNWTIISKSPELERIVRYACNALRKLQDTYEYGNVILAIQFYINIFEDALNNNYDDNKLPQCITKKENEYESLIDYKKLRNFWDPKKLKRICDLYDNCFNIYNDSNMIKTEKDSMICGYLSSINTILELADADFQKLVQNSNKG